MLKVEQGKFSIKYCKKVHHSLIFADEMTNFIIIYWKAVTKIILQLCVIGSSLNTVMKLEFYVRASQILSELAVDNISCYLAKSLLKIDP